MFLLALFGLLVVALVVIVWLSVRRAASRKRTSEMMRRHVGARPGGPLYGDRNLPTKPWVGYVRLSLPTPDDSAYDRLHVSDVMPEVNTAPTLGELEAALRHRTNGKEVGHGAQGE